MVEDWGCPQPVFFKLVTTKHITESIQILSLPDGRLMEEKSEILSSIYSHCKLLYKIDPEVACFNAIRTEVLKLISKKFLPIDNRKLQAPPNNEEIEKFVLGFPKENSSGGDGVTYEFL